MDTRVEVGLLREAWTRTKKFVLLEETVLLNTILDNVYLATHRCSARRA